MNAYETIPGLETRDGEPIFNEPWEAQAFALVVELHQKGHFTWQEWADELSMIIHSDEASSSYYKNWLSALDEMVSKKAILNEADIAVRATEWKAAVAATPHGEPIELENGSR